MEHKFFTQTKDQMVKEGEGIMANFEAAGDDENEEQDQEKGEI